MFCITVFAFAPDLEIQNIREIKAGGTWEVSRHQPATVAAHTEEIQWEWEWQWQRERTSGRHRSDG